MTAVTAGRWLEPALPLDETFDDILSAWRRYAMASGHSERTITSRAYTLRRLARSVDPMTATRDDLTDWLADLMDRRTGAPVTRSSRATYRAQVRAFYAFLVSCGRRGDDPSAGLPQPRVPRAYPRPLTPAEVVRVLAACEDPRAAQTRAYVVLACYAGLRVTRSRRYAARTSWVRCCVWSARVGRMRRCRCIRGSWSWRGRCRIGAGGSRPATPRGRRSRARTSAVSPCARRSPGHCAGPTSLARPTPAATSTALRSWSRPAAT